MVREHNRTATRIVTGREFVRRNTLQRRELLFECFEKPVGGRCRVQNDRSNRACAAFCLDDVERRVKRTKGYAHWILHRTGVDPNLARPCEWDSVGEENDRLIVSLRCPRGEKRERAGDIRWSTQRAIRPLLQAGNDIREGLLEASNGALRHILAPVRVLADFRPWKDRRSHPDRDEKKRDCAQREDCASPQAPASYIQTTD